MENIVSRLLFGAYVIWNLFLFRSVIKCFVYWICIFNYFVLLVQGMRKIMVLFCCRNFFRIWIRALFC